MHSITILMSTYNGDRFLAEQLDSILAQEGVKVKLLVRDDGSNDATKDILKKYSDDSRLTWYEGDNLGAAYSYMDLIKRAPEDEYYAFSDQDDVWKKNKLLSAVCAIERCGTKNLILYSCNTREVTSDLQPIDEAKMGIPVTTFCDALIHNNNQGCTMVFRKELLDELRKYNGKNLVMHDDLALKVCLSLGGKVIKDSVAYIDYRQHGNNVIGSHESFRHSLKRRLYSLFHQSCERSRELQDIYNIYEKIIPQREKELLAKVAFYKERKGGRLRILFDKKIRAKDMHTTWHFYVGILLGFF